MNTNNSSYCHHGSVQNYLTSPKMPVKDHLQAFKLTKTTFKQNTSFIDNQTKKLLGDHCSRFEQTANSTTKDPLHNAMNHVRNLQSMKKMKLVNEKSLYIVNHKSGKQNGNIGSHHDRQTNAGYSRNKLGGPFTS